MYRNISILSILPLVKNKIIFLFFIIIFANIKVILCVNISNFRICMAKS